MKDSLDSVHVGVLGEQLVFQPLFQGRPLGGAVVLLNKDGLKRRFFLPKQVDGCLVTAAALENLWLS